MFIRGTVLQVEAVKGTNNEGEKYAYMRAHVLEGVEVHRCRVSDDWPGSIPSQGEVIFAEVNVSAYPSRGSARLSVTLLRPAAVDALAA